MKRSRYNIFRKVDEDTHIIFNSFSLAIAKINKNFFKIYNNLENINLKILSDQNKRIYNLMLENNFIISDKTDELKDLEFFRLRRSADSKIFCLSIHPTLSCNFDCYYCYEKNKSGVMSKKVIKKVLELIKFHAERKSDIRIDWFGGEPLLTFDIIYDLSQKLINICKKNNVNYLARIATNGFLFTDDIISRMKECKISIVQVTLDGPPELHNKRRFLKNIKKGTFHKILDNAKKLKENDIKVGIRVNVNKDFNIDLLMKLVRILEKNDLKNNFNISQEFSTDTDNKSCRSEGCLSNKGFAKFNLNFCKKLHDLKILNLEKKYYPRIRLNYCGAARFNFFCVDPEGFLFKCHEDVGIPEKAVGNILDNNSFIENFFNNNVKYMTWNPFSFNKCRECNILPICGGNCPEKGIANNDPQCIEWKYNINDLIDTVAFLKIKENEKTNA